MGSGVSDGGLPGPGAVRDSLIHMTEPDLGSG